MIIRGIVLDGVVVVIIEVPANEVIRLVSTFAGVLSVSTADGSGIPVNSHSGSFGRVDPDVCTEVGVIPFYAAIGDRNEHIVRALSIVPSVKAADNVMEILLLEHGIIGHKLLTVDGFELCIVEVYVFTKRVHCSVDRLVAVEHNTIYMLQIHALIVPLGLFDIGVGLFEINNFESCSQIVKAAKTCFNNTILDGEINFTIYIWNCIFRETADNRAGLEPIRIKFDRKHGCADQNQRKYYHQFFH